MCKVYLVFGIGIAFRQDADFLSCLFFNVSQTVIVMDLYCIVRNLFFNVSEASHHMFVSCIVL